MRELAREREGVLFGVAAYLLWDLFPLFFPLLKPAGPVEILAHRVVWSLVAVVAVLALQRRISILPVLMRDRRRLALLSAAAVLIAVNWDTFIYAVNSKHVTEGSLGYFVICSKTSDQTDARERRRRSIRWTPSSASRVLGPRSPASAGARLSPCSNNRVLT